MNFQNFKQFFCWNMSNYSSVEEALSKEPDWSTLSYSHEYTAEDYALEHASSLKTPIKLLVQEKVYKDVKLYSVGIEWEPSPEVSELTL